MTIRLATQKDYRRIARALQNKKIDYITHTHAREDIQQQRLYVIEENGCLIAQCAIVEEHEHGYHAIKRLTVYNKKNCGRGIAELFIQFFCGMSFDAIGCTPWTDNATMKKLLVRNGFVYQYTFLGNYEFFLKKA